MFFVLYAKYLKLFTSGLNKNFYRNDRQPLVNRLSVWGKKDIYRGEMGRGEVGKWPGPPFPLQSLLPNYSLSPFSPTKEPGARLARI